jgi:hypothetical protein
MVRCSLIIAVLALLIPVAGRAELDLSPQLSHYELEGIKFPQLAFKDGTKKVTYAPPRGWRYSGNATKLTLQPPDIAQAEATITKVPLRQPSTMSDEGMKALVAEALNLVHGGSTEVTVVAQEKNAFPADGRETFLVTVTYALYGENYARSYLFLNRETDQIRFQFVCRASEFKALQKAFFNSLFSWQNL